jgi:hypothetical protein
MSEDNKNLQVQDKIETSDIDIVLYDRKYPKSPYGAFPNIEAFDKQGNKIWTVELPDYRARFNKMYIENGYLMAIDWEYECKIDLKTGKIIDYVFYK